jgi:hypothetical protein
MPARGIANIPKMSLSPALLIRATLLFVAHFPSARSRSIAGHTVRFAIDYARRHGMNILAAIKREERKVEKQLSKLQHQLAGIRAAAKALGRSTSKELTTVKKRVLSAAARAKMSTASKKRWAKVKAQAKKVG